MSDHPCLSLKSAQLQLSSRASGSRLVAGVRARALSGDGWILSWGEVRVGRGARDGRINACNGLFFDSYLQIFWVWT
jgi:hypothetical protein